MCFGEFGLQEVLKQFLDEVRQQLPPFGRGTVTRFTSKRCAGKLLLADARSRRELMQDASDCSEGWSEALARNTPTLGI